MNTSGMCKQYFTVHQSTGLELNAIPIEGNQVDGFTITFPYPFILIGLAQLDDVPIAPVQYSDAYITPIPTADQNTYTDFLLMLFIGLMEANRDDTDPINPALVINYLVDSASRYRNYFVFWLTPALYPKNYNTFLQPESFVKKWWAQELANPSVNLEERFFSMAKLLKESTDLRLWGAPGKYRINDFGLAYSPNTAENHVDGE